MLEAHGLEGSLLRTLWLRGVECTFPRQEASGIVEGEGVVGCKGEVHDLI